MLRLFCPSIFDVPSGFIFPILKSVKWVFSFVPPVCPSVFLSLSPLLPDFSPLSVFSSTSGLQTLHIYIRLHSIHRETSTSVSNMSYFSKAASQRCIDKQQQCQGEEPTKEHLVSVCVSNRSYRITQPQPQQRRTCTNLFRDLFTLSIFHFQRRHALLSVRVRVRHEEYLIRCQSRKNICFFFAIFNVSEAYMVIRFHHQRINENVTSA